MLNTQDGTAAADGLIILMYLGATQSSSMSYEKVRWWLSQCFEIGRPEIAVERKITTGVEPPHPNPTGNLEVAW